MARKVLKGQVMLQIVATGRMQDFDFIHAESILRSPGGGGWRLPENSEYEYTEDGLIAKSDKGVGGNTSKRSDKAEG